MNRNHKAFQLWEQGKLNEAIRLLFEEIEEQTENSDSYCNLASILILAKKYEDAQAVLETALQKYPNHLELLYTFGNLYYYKNMPEKSLVYFERVFQAEETSLKNDAAIMIGQCYLMLENPKKALVYLLLAYPENPKDSLLLLLLGDCFMQTGHFKEAKGYFEQAVAVTPDNDEAWFKRGVIGMALNESATTVESFFKTSHELNPEAHLKRLQQLQAIEKFIQFQEE